MLQFQSATASSLNAPVSIPSSLAFIDGLSGFVINNQNSTVSIDASVNGNSFQFIFNPNITYLNYQYFVIPDKGDPCFFCENSPYLFNGNCVAQCPQGGQPNNGQCSSCPPEEKWNGTHCVLRCTGGRIWNLVANLCECQNNLIWNGNSCISCPSGQIWNSTDSKCSCPKQNQIWNGQTCQDSPCGPNQILNTFTFQCECAPGTHKNGTECLKGHTSQTWNGSACVCPNGNHWNGNSCSNCSNNMVWNSTSNSCKCPGNSYFNGLTCISCSGGMVVDEVNNICKCPQN